MGHPSLS